MFLCEATKAVFAGQRTSFNLYTSLYGVSCVKYIHDGKPRRRLLEFLHLAFSRSLSRSKNKQGDSERKVAGADRERREGESGVGERCGKLHCQFKSCH